MNSIQNNQNDQDQIKNITTLLDNLKASDSKIKVEAVKNLQIISKALGRKRTRNELLPYVSGKIPKLYYI